MTPTREQVIQMAADAGFVGYGEETGEYCIPAPAFIARLERVIEAAMCAGRAQGLREAREVCEALAKGAIGMQSGEQSDLSNVMLRQVAVLGHGDCVAAIKQLEGK